MTKKVLVFLLVFFAGSLLSAAPNVDSLFKVFESASRNDKNKLSETLVRQFIKEEYISYPRKLTTSTHKKLLEAAVYLGMANYYYDKGDFLYSIDCAHLALQIVPTTVDSVLIFKSDCYEILAAAYFRDGMFDKSLSFAQKSEEIANRLNNDNLRSSALNTYAAVYLSMGRLKQAEKYIREAIQIERKQRQTGPLAIRLGMMSDILVKQTRYEEALVYINEALHLDSVAGRTEKMAVRFSQKADIFLATKNWSACVATCLRALDIFRKTGNLVSQAITLKQLGNAEMQLKHRSQAEAYYLESASICEKIGFRQILQIDYYNLYSIYKDYDIQKALDYLERSNALKDTLFSQERDQMLSEFEIKYNTQEKEIKLSLLEMKNRKKNYLITLLVFLSLLSVLSLVGFSFAYRNRKKRNQQLTEMIDEKDRYTSIISHDLKNPIAAQKHLTEILYENFENLPVEEMRYCLNELRKSTGSLDDLLFDLLQWSSLNCGRIVYNPVRLNFRSSVESTFRKLSTQASAKNVELKHNVFTDSYVEEDLHFVEFILRNLMTNAIKFSNPNSVVILNVEDAGAHLKVSITDSGVGMTQECQEHLFDTKTRSSKGTQGETGTGLGLVVCHQMIQKSGNHISVESQLGEGTTVTFTMKKNNNRSNIFKVCNR